MTRLVKADEPWWCETSKHKGKRVFAASKEGAAKSYMAYLGPWKLDDSVVVAVQRSGVGAAVYREPDYLRVTFQGFVIYVTRKATPEEFNK